MRSLLLLQPVLLLGSYAHLGPWHTGMYCINGPQLETDLNSNNVVNPLFRLLQSDWWLHHVDKCDEYPPPNGEMLQLPSGGQFTIEIATNRAKTSLSYDGRDTTEWPDGRQHPEDWNEPDCITDPNMHTQNRSMASGTTFAISYNSDIKKVTPENLVIFTVRHNTPWKRIATYDVPNGMPPCPAEGCICVWGWIPNGCGEPNMYQVPFRCNTTSSVPSTFRPLGIPKPAVWCEDDQLKCVRGPKQMLYWNQLTGNNIEVSGFDLNGFPRSPGYNLKCGFRDGAQQDIFLP